MKTIITKILLFALLSFSAFLSFGQTIPTISDFGNTVTTTPGLKKVAFGDCSYYGDFGNLITLTGTNLNVLTQLYINNAPITFTFYSSTLIGFTIPEGLSNQYSGKVILQYFDGSAYQIVSSIPELTVTGCPNSISSSVFAGGHLLISGYDLQNVKSFIATSPNGSFTGATFFDSGSGLLVPIPYNTTIDSYSFQFYQAGIPFSVFETIDSISVYNDSNQVIITSITPSTVTGGDLVSLTGQKLNTNFYSYYRFNGNDYYNLLPNIDGTTATIKTPFNYGKKAINSPIIAQNIAVSPQLLTVLPNPTPIITSFNKSAAYPGETITILGDNLENFGSPNWKLLFPIPNIDNSISYAKFVTKNRIELEIPGIGDTSRIGNISIVGYNTNEFLNKSIASFTIKAYNFSISGISTTTGIAYKTITVFGQNFVPGIEFYFPASNATSYGYQNTYINPNTYLVGLPSSGVSGTGPIIGKYSKSISTYPYYFNYNTTFSGAFTLLFPSITGVSQSLVPSGASVTVFGQNLNTLDKENYNFQIYGQSFPYSVYSDINILSGNAIVLKSIGKFPTGDKLSIYANGSTYGSLFEVITVTSPPNPIISAINPLSAHPFEKISVTGANLYSITQLFISGNSITNFNQTDNTIEFQLPFNDVYIGPITFENVITTVSSIQNFTVLGPNPAVVNSISANSAYPKTIITLLGSGFVMNNSKGEKFDIYFNGNQIYPNVLSDSVLTIKTPSFYDNKDLFIISNFIIEKDQAVFTTVNPAFTLNFPPAISISGFSPATQIPKGEVTFTGTNLKYIENISLFDALYDYIFVDFDENSLTPDGQLVVKIQDNFSNAFDSAISIKAPFRYSPLTNSGNQIVSSFTGSDFTVLPYPIPTITGVIAPSKVYPNSRITIIGENFNAIDNASTSYGNANIEYKSPNNDLLILKFNLSYVQNIDTVPIRLYPSARQESQYDIISSDSIVIYPFDGSLTILGINKTGFTSADKVVLTVVSTGVFNSQPLRLEFSENFANYYDIFEVDNFTAPSVDGISIIESKPLYLTDFSNGEGYDYIYSGDNYNLRISYAQSYAYSYTGIAGFLNKFSYRRTPVYNPDFPFYPFSGTAGDTIIVKGYHFENSSIIGIYFGNNFPAQYTIIDNNNIEAIVPNGIDINTFVPITIKYANEEIASEFEFNKYPKGCPGDFIRNWYIGNNSSGSKNILQSNEVVDINVQIVPSDEFVYTITSELSDANGDFTNYQTIGTAILDSVSKRLGGGGVSVDPKGKGGESANQNENGNEGTVELSTLIGINSTIPGNIIDGENYAIRIRVSVGFDYCTGFPKTKITITGSNLASITGISINGNGFLRGETISGSVFTSGQFAQDNDFIISLVNPMLKLNGDVATLSGFNLGAPPHLFSLIVPNNAIIDTNYRIAVRSTSPITPPVFSQSFSIDSIVRKPSAVQAIKIVLADTSLTPAIDTIGGSLQLAIEFIPDSLPKEKILWLVSNSFFASVDSTGLIKGKRNGEVKVFAVLKSNPVIRDSILITLINQYEPVVAMTLFADEDSTDIFAKAFEILPVNAGFIPENATNQRYRLQLIQSAPLIVETDTLEHLFEFLPSVNANGTATIVGTSLDNPTVTSTVVIYIIGQEVVSSDTIKPRFVGSTIGGSNFPNPCDASLELFIDTVGNKYLGFQWYYVSSKGDTAKVVNADKSEFRPVVQGNYYIEAYDSTYNYEYKSFPLTFTGPLKPTIIRPGVDDIEADTTLKSSESNKYQWFVDGKLIKGATDQTLRVFYNGTYYVSIADDKNCKTISDTSYFGRPDFVDIARAELEINGNTIENYGKPKGNLKLYPNPATDQFAIQYTSNSKRTLRITIFNSFGQEMMQRELIYNKSQLRILNIPVSNLNTGLYYVQVADGENVMNSKILVK